MIIEDGKALLTASDLTRASGCEWQVLTAVDARLGRRAPLPAEADAMLERTAMLGDRHEAAILERLRASGEVVEIAKGLDAAGRAAAVAATREAIARRAPTIFQAAFEDERFFGYADFVELVDGAYVVSDAKLARHAKVTALLQLATYAGALRAMGAPVADEVRLLLGDGTVSVHRLRDIEPVLLERRARLERIVDERLGAADALAWGTEGVLACGACPACEQQIELHDDVFQVAGLRRDQRTRLRAAGIRSLPELAAATVQPKGMAAATFETLRRCPASRRWQDFFSFEVGDGGVGQAEVDVDRPVPGDRLVRSHGVVLGPVVLGAFDELEGVGDLVEEQPFVLQRAEAALA